MSRSTKPESIILRIVPFLILCGFLISGSRLLAQTGDTTSFVFVLQGDIKVNNKTVAGVSIVLKKKDQEITRLLTTNDGKYVLNIKQVVADTSGEYLVYISKTGLLGKILSINTAVPPKQYAKDPFPSYDYDLEISLTPLMPNDIVLKQAFGRIKWNAKQKGFGIDQSYAKVVQNEQEKLKSDPQYRKDQLKKQKEEEQKQKKIEAEKKRLEDEKKKKEEEDKIKATQQEAARLAEEKAKEEAEKARLAQEDTDRKAAAELKSKQDAALAAEKAGSEIKETPVPDNKTEAPADKKVETSQPTAKVEVNPKQQIMNEMPVIPISPEAYSLRAQEGRFLTSRVKEDKIQAANLSGKYETSNALTSLLDVIAAHDKKNKKE